MRFVICLLILRVGVISMAAGFQVVKLHIFGIIGQWAGDIGALYVTDLLSSSLKRLV